MIDEKIKNIVFDLGGVLVGLDPERCIEAFREIGCGEIAFYVEEHRTEDLFLDTELGRITRAQFCDEVRRLCGGDRAATLPGDDRIVWAWNRLLTTIPDEKKARLLQLRERGYRLFLLSNTNEMHWTLCRDELFGYRGHTASDYFERIFLSYEMHLAKPSAEIFRETLRQTGINAGETLFIDDSELNCHAAEEVGITTLHENTGHRWLYEI